MLVVVAVAVTSGVDTRVVAAFRGGRTIPYRVAFFAALFAACFVLLSRSIASGSARAYKTTVALGAVCGYVSGFVGYVVVQIGFVSVRGAWLAIVGYPAGVLVPLVVPLMTFSWVMGALAFLAADLISRGVERTCR
jgi:hypothetical protein